MAKSKRIPIDLTGQIFGRLTVTSEAEATYSIAHRVGGDTRQRLRWWHCTCACGNTVTIRQSSLQIGRSQSCGCWHKERVAEVATTHNMSKSYIYSCWCAMKRRCYDPNFISYPYYGALGITVCQRWIENFEAFLEDMGLPPDETYTVDRINTYGHYEPENCRWATEEQQHNNTRSNIHIEFQGQSLTLAQWSRKLGISYQALVYRYHAGWLTADMFTVPVGSQQRHVTSNTTSK